MTGETRAVWLSRAVLTVVLLLSAQAAAQGVSVLTGKVTDASNQNNVEDVLVTARSPAVQGELVVVTDADGFYRIPNLPPGEYTLRLEKEGFKPTVREGIVVSINKTLRVNLDIAPESLVGETIVVVGRPPVVDVGSSAVGVTVNSDFVSRLPVIRPGGKNSASRSFDSLADVAPGAKPDDYGQSINGTTSPENRYVIDGVAVNNPATGLLGTALPIDFMEEVNIVTAGYMPEYGRSLGGVFDAVTKTGSNEFKGSVWLNYSPGSLLGSSKPINRSGESVSTDMRLWNEGNIGAELGGPIVKDRLWFYAGISPSATRFSLLRRVNRLLLDNAGMPATNEQGLKMVEPIAGTDQRFFADQRTVNYVAKLTLQVAPDHRFSLSVFGAPSGSGGKGAYGIIPTVGLPDSAFQTAAGSGNIGNGTVEGLSRLYSNDSRDLSARWNSAFADKRLLLDATLGWHHEFASALPSDGSGFLPTTGLSGWKHATWNAQYPITNFESIPDPSACIPPPGADPSVTTLCPVSNYQTGGNGMSERRTLDTWQAQVVGTGLVNLLGHHVFKAGFEALHAVWDNSYAFPGYGALTEYPGNFWLDTGWGYLDGPGSPRYVASSSALSKGTTLGGFVQDSWSIFDVVTLNAGVRYDTTNFYGNDGKLGMVLPNQWSPRIGLVYDLAQTINKDWAGRSRLYGNWARYYQNTPMDVVDRLFPGQPMVWNLRALPPGCDPTTAASADASCQGATNQLLAIPYANEKTPVDPAMQAESMDELVVGGEWEVFKNTRAGVSYMRRRQNRVIEDMSVNAGASFMMGNPGYGLGQIFPKAIRDYDAVTVQLSRAFSDNWVTEASYTWSRAYGNWSGLYRPETLQLNPNNTSDFDNPSALTNRTGMLPISRTHAIKLYAARDILFDARNILNVGGSYRTQSGAPLNALGASGVYGPNEVFILPRGSVGELPWVHTVDLHLGYTHRLNKDQSMTIGVDIFNLFNFQQYTRVDETYSFGGVKPIPNGRLSDLPTYGGTALVDESDAPVAANDPNINRNYKRPLQYQTPRVFRFGAKVTF